MKKWIVLVSIGGLLFFCMAGFRMFEEPAVVQKAAAALLEQNGILKKEVDALATLVNSASLTPKTNRNTFQSKLLSCRLAYKRMEWAYVYYYPSLATRINGTDVIEEEEPTEFEPAHGLQVIENLALKNTAIDNESLLKLKQELHRLSITVGNFPEAISRLTATFTPELLAALKLEIIKVTLTGFTEYDNPIMNNYLHESAAALNGVRDVLMLFQDAVSPALMQGTGDVFDKATAYLLQNKNANAFDRMFFITHHYNVLSKLVDDYASELKVSFTSYNPCVNLQAASVFEAESFRTFFTDGNPEQMAKRVALGKSLFFDPLLSGNYQRSCASCHNPDKGFTDGFPKSKAYEPNQTVSRNAPTVINSCMQVSFFDDAREASLEEQIGEVVNNPRELHNDFATILTRLESSPEYKKMFDAAFPGEAMTASYVKRAIADYERSLVGFNSDFDKYLKGERNKLSVSQIRGFNLFMGKAKCGSCHFPPLFNGVLPPLFNKSEFEIIGALETNDFLHPHLDKDEGAGPIKKAAHLKFGFKVPGLRNVALTAPYMHNGAMKTLDDVLTFYNKGGGAAFGLDVSNQTLSNRPLGLSKEEMKDIIHFMQSLTDTTGLTSRPARLPELAGDRDVKNRNRETVY